MARNHRGPPAGTGTHPFTAAQRKSPSTAVNSIVNVTTTIVVAYKSCVLQTWPEASATSPSGPVRAEPFAVKDGVPSMRFETHDSASMLFHSVDIDVAAYPILAWRCNHVASPVGTRRLIFSCPRRHWRP